MVMVDLLTQMEICMKVNGKMIKRKDWVFIFTLTGLNTKVNGLMINNKEKV